jgi:hypothetical protein
MSPTATLRCSIPKRVDDYLAIGDLVFDRAAETKSKVFGHAPREKTMA